MKPHNAAFVNKDITLTRQKPDETSDNSWQLFCFKCKIRISFLWNYYTVYTKGIHQKRFCFQCGKKIEEFIRKDEIIKILEK